MMPPKYALYHDTPFFDVFINLHNITRSFLYQEKLKWVSFFASSQKERKCLSDERMKQDPFASRTLPAPLSRMLQKLLPRGNLILGHKHPGGCGRTKFTKK